MPRTTTNRSSAELTATIISMLLTQPQHWTRTALEQELGETRSRIYSTLRAIETSGHWTLTEEQDGYSQRLSITPTAQSAPAPLTLTEFTRAASAALSAVWEGEAPAFAVQGVAFGLEGIREDYDSAQDYIQTNRHDLYHVYKQGLE